MKTRKEIAAEVWERLKRGPQFGINETPMAPAEIRSRYRGWAETWILAEVARLVPELRDKLDVLGNVKKEERS